MWRNLLLHLLLWIALQLPLNLLLHLVNAVCLTLGVRELSVVRKELKYKFGKKFVDNAINNGDRKVHHGVG